MNGTPNQTPGEDITGQPLQVKSRYALTLIFIIKLLDVMGITMLSPVAPQVVLRYSSEAVIVTMITVIYACGQFIAAPLIGKLGGHNGRRRCFSSAFSVNRLVILFLV